MTTGKTIALTIQTFVGKVVSLLFNMLPRFVIAFLSKSQATFNFMAAVTICSDFGAQENKVCHCFHFSPLDLPWSNRTAGHGTTDWFQIGKGVRQGCILSPCLFNSYAEYIMRSSGLEEAQAGIKIARRNINNLRYADDTTLMAKSEEELKTLLMNVKEESEKVGLKLNIQKTKIMASGPITSWQIDGETVETVSDFICWAPKSLQMVIKAMTLKRCLLLGRKVITKLDSILKSRDITLPTEVGLVKAMVFPMVMYGCESWTIKKGETEELMLLNCGVGEDSWESLGLQGDPTSPC